MFIGFQANLGVASCVLQMGSGRLCTGLRNLGMKAFLSKHKGLTD